ncbi:MAG: phage portal protein [bacterium]|nr:phage portal protein [bacterium]
MGIRLNQETHDQMLEAALAQLLQTHRVGQWASDHTQEAKAYQGWNYLAIAALGREAARAHSYVYDNSQPKAKSSRTLAKAQHGSMWRSFAQDGASDVVADNHWVSRLVERPNKYQSGQLFRWEFIQQLHLHGTCLIWNRPSADGSVVAARYIIPMSMTEPVYIGEDKQNPEGGVRILPTRAGLGWYLNPMISYLSGATISVEQLSLVRYPHPILRGDGKSPSDAAGNWIDVSTMIDDARWRQMRKGPRPSGLISVDGEEVTVEELEEIEERINEKLQDESFEREVIAVRGSVRAEGNPFSPTEMDYVQSFEQLGQATLAVHGASKALVGLTDNMTYGSLAAALRQAGAVVQSDLDLLAGEWTATVQDKGAAVEVEFEVQPVDDPTLTEQQLSTDLSAGVRLGREWRSIRGLPPFGDWRDDARVTSSGFVFDPPEPPKASGGQQQPSGGAMTPSPSGLFRSMGKAMVVNPTRPAEGPVVAVDFDGTLATYEGEFEVGVYGAPMPAVVEKIQQLHQAGCQIVIFTCRDEDEMIAQWLANNDVPFDAINMNPGEGSDGSGKVFADVYLDDRALLPEAGLKDIARLLPDGPAKQRISKDGRSEGDVGVIMFEVPEAVATEVKAMQGMIAPETLTGDGLEDWPHVTLLYGIVGVPRGDVVDLVRSIDQFDIEFGKTSLFSNDERDVIKIDVESPQIRKYHDKLASILPVEESGFEGYEPHMTVAYVKPGAYEDRGGVNKLTGKLCRVTHAVVSMDGKKVRVPLRGGTQEPEAKAMVRKIHQPPAIQYVDAGISRIDTIAKSMDLEREATRNTLYELKNRIEAMAKSETSDAKVLEKLDEVSKSVTNFLAKFNANQPRGSDGKWIPGGDVEAAIGNPDKLKQLFEKIDSPEEADKFVEFIQEKGGSKEEALQARKDGFDNRASGAPGAGGGSKPGPDTAATTMPVEQTYDDPLFEYHKFGKGEAKQYVRDEVLGGEKNVSIEQAHQKLTAAGFEHAGHAVDEGYDESYNVYKKDGLSVIVEGGVDTSEPALINSGFESQEAADGFSKGKQEDLGEHGHSVDPALVEKYATNREVIEDLAEDLPKQEQQALMAHWQSVNNNARAEEAKRQNEVDHSLPSEGSGRTIEKRNEVHPALRTELEETRELREMYPEINDAIEHYTTEGYADLNHLLRQGDTEAISGRYKSTMNQLDELTDKELIEPVTVYRGLGDSGESLLSQIEEGDELSDAAFMSTSPNAWEAAQFAYGDKPVMMQIKAKRGMYVQDVETELVMKRNARLRVVGIDRDVEVQGSARDAMATIIRLEEI